MPLAVVLALLLFCGTASGGAKPKPTTPKLAPAEPYRLPEMKVLSEVDIPGTTKVFGREVRMHALNVQGHAADLAVAFWERFSKARFYIPPFKRLSQMSTSEVGIVGLDLQKGISHVVILKAAGPNETTVILGDTSLKRESEATDTHGFAVPPDAQNLFNMDSEGGWMLSYSTKSTPAQVQQLYADQLRRAGFAKDEEVSGLAPAYRRGGEHLQIQLSPGANDRTQVVLLGRLRGAAVDAQVAPPEELMRTFAPDAGTPPARR